MAFTTEIMVGGLVFGVAVMEWLHHRSRKKTREEYEQILAEIDDLRDRVRSIGLKAEQDADDC